MTYQRPPTVLIARQGYSGYEGVGAESDRAAATSYCGQKFGVSSPDFQPCIAHYVAGKSGDYVSSGSNNASGSPGPLAQIGSFFGDLLKGAVTSYATAKGTAPVTVAPASATPPWLMPVAIGAVGLIAVVMLTKPRSNPARRRRRR